MSLTDLMRLCIYCIIVFKRKVYVICEVKREKLKAVRVYVYDRKRIYEVCVFMVVDKCIFVVKISVLKCKKNWRIPLP